MKKKQSFILPKDIYILSSIRDLLRWAITQFNTNNICYGQGTNNELDEALQLIFSSLKLSTNYSKELLDSKLTKKEKKIVINNIKKRVKERIPTSYLINKAWLCSLEFYVDERVVIPRSPIGEIITDNFRDLIKFKPKNILDVCTGSGCLSIIAAEVYSEAFIDASDISEGALNVAKFNIKKYNLQNRINLVLSDLFSNIYFKSKKYDLIIINPPYVNKTVMNSLPKEFLHEPEIGLFGGNDGLVLIRKILNESANFLSDNGVLVCEVGENMSIISQEYSNAPFIWIDCIDESLGVFMINKKNLLMLK
ncbi:yfcB [Wigglesworthia glossinidia endosymbiont of Glossina brevipalpis]|uniref:YfcB protein n=1 Tax=Wigglesworthia glossinidia brevipalpis TaxID=36870 RepID=Q8D2E5_WIGBR|nr:yfcB [Wigglesworthia glossinidia endosymbiont of Glossina brevipalpis]